MDPVAFLLIALLKTSGEGGTVQIAYPTEAACIMAGQQLAAQFTALTLPPNGDGSANPGHPKAIWTCFEAPVQR